MHLQTFHSTGVLISPYPDQEGNKLHRPNLTFASHSKTIQNVVRPTRSPRQQWPPRRTENGDLSIVFFSSRVGLWIYQHPCIPVTQKCQFFDILIANKRFVAVPRDAFSYDVWFALRGYEGPRYFVHRLSHSLCSVMKPAIMSSCKLSPFYVTDLCHWRPVSLGVHDWVFCLMLLHVHNDWWLLLLHARARQFQSQARDNFQIIKTLLCNESNKSEPKSLRPSVAVVPQKGTFWRAVTAVSWGAKFRGDF